MFRLWGAGDTGLLLRLLLWFGCRLRDLLGEIAQNRFRVGRYLCLPQPQIVVLGELSRRVWDERILALYLRLCIPLVNVLALVKVV